MNAGPARIAVGGILTECNHSGGPVVGRDAFARYDLHYDEEVSELTTGVAGGAIGHLRGRGAVVRPLLYASACPCGLVEADCYQTLRQELLDRLARCESVDGVLLLLHGAMAAEGVPDAEGDLIRAVRAIVGPHVPLVATLDLHAQVTQEMVEHSTALVAWETYPHRDAETTGTRAARLILSAVSGECRPVMAMGHVPVLTGGVLGSTEGDGPFARLMRHTKTLEKHGDVVSASLFLGHPYLDLPRMGSGGLVVTNGDRALARKMASELAHAYWEARHDLEPITFQPEEAIRAGLAISGEPVVLVEAADCCGGGAAGDSVASLRALLQHAPRESALVPVVDAAAAAACHRAGLDAEITLDIGHAHDPQWGQPLPVSGRVTRLGDGRFRYRGGIWDQVEGAMGPVAVLAAGAVNILIATYPTYDWRDEQYRSLGLEPERVKFVVVKNPMNYHMAYDAIAAGVYLLDTPGPTPASVRNVPFERLRHAFFPRVTEIPNLEPIVWESRSG